MAYIEPLVMVYQEYATLSTSTETATLPACIIGPCYDIIDAEEDEVRAYAGAYTEIGFDKEPIPGIVTGTIIDEASLRFRFKNPRVRLAGPVEPVSISTNKLKFTEDTYPKGVAVGDYVKFASSDGVYRVYSVDADNFEFLINKSAPKAEDQEVTYAQFTEAFFNGNRQEIGEVENTFALEGVVWQVVEVDAENYACKVVRAADQSGIDYEFPAEGTIETRLVPGSMAVSIERTVDEFVLSSTDSGITADASSYKFSAIGVTAKVYVTEDGVRKELGDFPVTQAELYVGCRALRQDLSSVGVCYTVDEIKANLGKIVPENPLAYGVNVALANSADTGIYYVGVDSDDLVGYNAAKDKVSNYAPLYSIVPLTMNVGILNEFKLHAVAMSEAEIGQWRIAFGCTELPTETVLCESAKDKNGNFLATGVISADGDGDLCWLKDPDGIFLSSSCDTGDTLVIDQTLFDENDNPVGIKQYKFAIEAVPTDDIIVVDQNDDFSEKKDFPYGPGASVVYHVIHKLDKEGQAKAIAAASDSFGDKRFVHVWPDKCVIDGHELPGYYLCCAVAGAISSLQPHYGLTRLSIAGIEAVKHAGEYFNRNQLNIIADGGTFIFTQDAPNAAPYIRHQLTSDRSAIEFQEVSFVKNFDYVCYILKDVLDEYIGTWNITESTLKAIRTSIVSVMENLKGQVYPKIGSPVLSYSIGDIKQSEASRDRVEAYVNVTFPYPLNTLALHVVSQ